jgi:hypothetical protein
MAIAASGLTAPQDGVMAIRAAMAPEDAPRVVGCPSRTFSTRSQTTTPAHVAATLLQAATAALLKWTLNSGVMGLVASFGVGYFMLGMSDKDILEDFPASIVMTIIGVTYFFSMAQRNGSIDIFVQTCVRLVRGKTMLLPWVFFLMAAGLTALSTFSPAAVALLAPAALGLAYEWRIRSSWAPSSSTEPTPAASPRCPSPACWCTTLR